MVQWAGEGEMQGGEDNGYPQGLGQNDPGSEREVGAREENQCRPNIGRYPGWLCK
jgi:hypothetical protein